MSDKYKDLRESLVKQIETSIKDTRKIEEYGDTLKGFLQIDEIIKNDKKGTYIEYLEEMQKKEQKRVEELKKIQEERALSKLEEEQLESYASSYLTQEDYVFLKFADQNKSKAFIADNKELTDSWFKDLDNQIESNKKELKEKYGEKHKDIEESTYETGAILKTFVKKFPVKATIDMTKLFLNPVGFMVSKSVSKLIGAGLRTEQGQKMVSSFKDKWEQVKGRKSLKSKKGLVALATVGAVAVVAGGLHAAGMIDLTEVGEVAWNALSNDSTEALASNGIAGTSKEFVAQTLSESNVEPLVADMDGQAVEITNNEVVAKHGELEAERRMATVPDAETLTADVNENVVEVPQRPTQIEIGKGDRLESLAKGMLPEDATYNEVRDFTRKIAEFNGLEDADSIRYGETLKIPTDAELKGIELSEFKVSSIDDLNKLEKLPYGTELTPDELKSQITETLKEAYPNDEARVHEYMAHVNANLDRLPKGEMIDSKTDLRLGDIHKELLVDRSYSISDELTLENDSPYDWDAINELKEETKVEPTGPEENQTGHRNKRSFGHSMSKR